MLHKLDGGVSISLKLVQFFSSSDVKINGRCECMAASTVIKSKLQVVELLVTEEGRQAGIEFAALTLHNSSPLIVQS